MSVNDRIFVELMYESQMHPAHRWYFKGTSRRIAIGRSADNDIVLSAASVSRRHVEILRVGSDWYFKNLGKNGCYADGQRIEDLPLWDGARVRLGRTGPILRFGFVRSFAPETVEPAEPVAPRDFTHSQAKPAIALGPAYIPNR